MVEKLDRSFNISEDTLNQLKKLIPEAFKDGLVDIGALSEALSGFSGEDLDIDDNLFGLYWPGKRKAKRAAAIPPVGTIVPVPGDGVDEETTKNIYIEGENLEVLKIIRKAYLGKIKMIYIDPPYNTGNDFIYPDDFSETEELYKRRTGQIDENGVSTTTNKSSEGRFHSNWCSMMYPRLRLARDLLSDDGVIFISIDDNEVAQLRKICDEIFGAENFIDCLIWKKRYGGGAKEKYLVTLHEYILFYAKTIDCIGEIFIPLSEESINRYYNKRDSKYELRGGYRTHPLEAGKAMDKRQNLIFGILAPDGTLIYPKKQWLWSKDRVLKAIANDEIEILKGQDNNWVVSSKQYLKEENGEIRPGKAFSIIDDVYTQHGTNEMIKIFGNAKIFNYPKPIGFLKKLLEVGISNNSIVLDFFSGSSTTAHAVMQLNVEDGGNRQFIMVQLQEKCQEKTEAFKAGFKNICEIGKERIRRAGKKIKEEAGLNAKTLDTGFKVFRLAPSNFKQVTPYTGTNVKELPDWFSGDPLVEDWKQENLISEVMLKEGFPLDSAVTKLDTYKKNKVYQVSSDSCDHSLIICLDVHIENDTIEKLNLGELDIFICLDRAITDQAKARLDDKGRIVVI
jgi:adenine-specific DNA-methyltransferase